MNAIQAWKEKSLSRLPAEDLAVERNHAITATYASLYLERPDIFKWAGMAAFASHHVGIALVPYKLKKLRLINLKESCQEKSLLADLNLIRHLNTMIFDDIAWAHQAYLDGGIDKLTSIMADSDHYRPMLEGFSILEQVSQQPQIEDADDLIWKANTKLLRHEQAAVVQPAFDSLGSVFQNILTFCASLDFNPSHLKTDWRLHSSFLFYMYLGAPSVLFHTSSLPNLTVFKQRWTWLENKVVNNWRQREKTDEELIGKFEYLAGLG